MCIDTCLIEPDENRLTLVYCAFISIECDSRYLKTIHFERKHER
jgi:hypothetical protein